MRRDRQHEHIFSNLKPELYPYSRPRQPIKPTSFTRPNPDVHGKRLSRQLSSLKAYFAKLSERREAAKLSVVNETYVSVEYNPKGVKDVTALEDKRKDISIALVHQDPQKPEVATAVLRLGKGELAPLERKVEFYRDKDKQSEKGVRRNEELLGGVTEFRPSVLSDFWTSETPIPVDIGREIFWEIWLPRTVNLAWFRRQAARVQLTILEEHALYFPDRRVVLGRGTTVAIRKVLTYLGQIMELRKPSVVKDFVDLSPGDQRDWIEQLRVDEPETGACSICLLDTGIDHSHPLIESAVSVEQVLAYNPVWGTADFASGHGTNMAGILVFGDELDRILLEEKPDFGAPCYVESVKIIPEPPSQTEERLYGEVTQAAIATVEATRSADRVFCMAVTAESSAKGAPSAWSAAVDQSCFGSDEEESPKRLIVISAGNARWSDPEYSYPDYNITDRIQDPAQAWNAMIVGAFTNNVSHDIDDYPGWVPVAPLGRMSPTTTTSALWDKAWPDRPDIVMEGGNLLSFQGAHQLPDCLSLLTARRRKFPRDPLLTSFAETSCATALAARLCGQIMNEHPGRWAETIRGLVVHSARWTKGMRDEVSGLSGKKPYRNLLRTVGMGVPDLQRALRSAKDSVTLVAEHTLYPFDERGRLNELHLHELPWPKQALEQLGSAEVRMRVTLSYFIDPRPGRRDFKTKYNYASHGLRFEVKTPRETLGQFLARINEKAKGGQTKSESDTDRWMIGPEIRNRGSLHSDIWSGTAQELVDKEMLAIIPVKGWWADDPDKQSLGVRYSLVVSIETAEPNTEIDLYAEIKTVIRSRTEVETRTEVEVDGFSDTEDWLY